MSRYYRVIMADTAGGVYATASLRGWKVVEPVQEFIELDSDHDNTLGKPGRLLVKQPGYVALAYRDD